MIADSPKRVLHVVRGMVNAGVETWLMHTLRRIDPHRVRMDFLVHTAERCAYDEEIEANNSRLFRCTAPLHAPAYRQAVREVLLSRGPFDVIHSHVHHFSGYLVRVAAHCGVPARIAHSHSDTAGTDRCANWVRRSYLTAMRRWIGRYATKLVGASRQAGESLFGSRWTLDGRSRVLHCGIDFSRFPRGTARAGVRSSVRAAWRIGEHDLVMGHVGRFGAPKNHEFLLRTFAAVLRREPGARLLLVGDGPLRPQLEKQACELGIGERVIFAGVQQEIPQLLTAMDVFVFPSIHEGLGLAFLEAQAAGLPCVVSEVVPKEADVVLELADRLSLLDAPECWARAVIGAARRSRPTPDVSLARMEASDFHISRSLAGLYSLYGA